MSVGEERNDPAGTVYGGRRASRPGLPRDPLMRAALGVGLAGVLLGTFFATGVLGGGGDEPVVPAAAGTPSTAPETTASAAPSESTAPSPTAVAPTTPAAPTAGPRVFRAAASGLCLGLDGAGERALAQLAVCTGGPEQQWVVNPAGPDVVTLTNAASGQCLDVEGGSTDDGTKLLQFPCHGQPNQLWRLTPAGTGPVLLVAVHSGRCGQVDDGGTEGGDDVEQAACTGAVEQQWNRA